jgi:hypothetical protein
MIGILFLVLVLPPPLLQHFAPGDAFQRPPRQFAEQSELKEWIEKHKGYGAPQSIDFDLNGIRLFVAWDGPFSGRAANVSWVYFRARNGKWHLLDTTFHQERSILSFVYVDVRSVTLVYIGTAGKRIKSLNLRPILYR